jgi:hypothetical protein
VTSNINYLSINENFPVAGEDNDTQVFRDNFDTIKTSLRNAKEEITALQDNTAKTTEDNDFGLFKLTNAVLQTVREAKWPGEIYSGGGVDWQQGSYHIYTVDTNRTLYFSNLPGDPAYVAETTPVGVGRITVELYSDGSDRTVTFSTTGGTVIKSYGFPGFASGGTPTISLTADNQDNPVIFEVWRHSQETIFLKYVGEFK